MEINAYTLRDAIRTFFQDHKAEVIREKEKQGKAFFIARVEGMVYKVTVERVS